ncbi:MAG TPA: cellulose binding domain-containing protein, partial [Pseudonocardiaceae bacterium]|nr:cellulose binding domain-containing protein [Pseudonocardiaceae bacterium]
MKYRRVFTRALVCAAAAVPLLLSGATAALPAAAAASPACVVQYQVQNDWGAGATVNINLTNNGPAVSSWTLGFAFAGNQTVNQGWNGTYSQNGANVTVASLSYNGSLATGGSASTGFNLSYSGTNAVPTTFTLNGTACNGATSTPGAPTAGITSPTANQAFTAPATVTINASAAETGGSISKVEFFAGSTLLGTSTTAPYTFSWANVAAGSYSLTAEAFDAAGHTVTSTAVPITVATSTGGGGPTGAAPQLHVSGNQLVNSAGATVVLHGVNRSGGEFACVQGNGIWDGPMDQASVTAIKSWNVTAVRVPLNEACWNAESYVTPADAGATYQQAVEQYVNLLNSNGIVAILDLHWTDGLYTGNSAGCSSAQATCQKPMPDSAEAIPFWTSVASTFKGNNA